MKCIYDIVLNFNELLYEFYEWSENDSVEYIKRIPIIKVSKENMNVLKKYKIILDSEILGSIKNLCEVYTENNIKKLEYACLFCSSENVLAIEFNGKGVSLLKSDLQMDEALDIIEYSSKMKCINISYNIIGKEIRELCTRVEIEKIDFMTKELKYIYENNIDKLKYIYYECFNEIEEDIKKMYKRVKDYISNTPKELYNLLMLKGLQK